MGDRRPPSRTAFLARGIDAPLGRTKYRSAAAGRTSLEFQISYGQYSFTAIAVGRIGICDSDWRSRMNPRLQFDAWDAWRPRRGAQPCTPEATARARARTSASRRRITRPFHRCRAPARRRYARAEARLPRADEDLTCPLSRARTPATRRTAHPAHPRRLHRATHLLRKWTRASPSRASPRTSNAGRR